jgi:mannosylglycoprotein endo-beta-mannosidase
LRGWAKNLSSLYKKEKERLLSLIDVLDKIAEVAPLDDSDRASLRQANESLAKLCRDEESKLAKRAKVKHVQESGNNTKYFHLIANGKHRREKIFQLEQDEGTIVGEKNLKVYITEFYKKLFGAPTPNFFYSDESENHDIPQLSNGENEILVTNFTEQEVYDAIFQMEKNKASGPDVFPAEFYQKLWDVIKIDLIALFMAFQEGSLLLFQLNFGTIILLPKKEDAIQIQQYGHICL